MFQNQKVLLIILAAFLFQGCVTTTAVWQSKTYKPKKGGVVFYNSRISIFDSQAVQKRRQDALFKMRLFCEPQQYKIVSEENKEEVTGYQTSYQSREDNPNPSYREEVRASDGFYTKSAQSVSDSSLHSQATRTEQAITRERLYIHFICE